MIDRFTEAAASLSGNPVMQGIVAALATFVLEDPTTIGSGLLVADGRMGFTTALVGVSSGIAIGDIGLYVAGRLAGPRAVRRGWLRAASVDRASAWFDRNMLLALVVSRFVPGMRIPTFVGAGVLRAPWWKFVSIAIGASLVWTFALLHATIALGERVMPMLGRWRWPVAIAAVLLLLVLQRAVFRRVESHVDDREAGVSWFEFWPAWLFYTPVAIYCAALALRYRSLTLPTVANPSIYSGGLIGESKSQILDLVPPGQRRWIAPYIVVVRPDDDALDDRFIAGLRTRLGEAGLELPLVAKPDVGHRGAGIRPVRNEAELREYLRRFPQGRSLLLQRLVPDETCAPVAGSPHGAVDDDLREVREAGVMYWRHPNRDRGTLFSITLKLHPAVTGDGRRTVRELIEADPRARRISELYFRRLEAELERVPRDGESIPLVFAGNHCQGAIFRDGTALATPELLERVHGIAAAMPEFYFGRFDVRFADPAAFLRGEELAVIEINGAGAEATHIWDGTTRLTDAYRTLFRQFGMLFEIAAANRRRGFRPLGPIRALRDAMAYRRLARSYPSTR